MARSNSPGYPNMSLPKAVSAIRKIFEADRRNPIDRVTAAKHIGYAGVSGASDKALASLAHYGLTEKTGKGEIRVSALALDIIHPDPTDPRSEARALWQAGMAPQVFKDLRARFPDHVSEDSLRSYLVREGFNNIAIPPLTNAFFETFRFLEQYKDIESGGIGADDGADSEAQANEQGVDMSEALVLERRNPPPPPTPTHVPTRTEAGEIEWMRNPLGRDKSVRVLATGTMGSKDIAKLIKLLEAQMAILDDDDEGDEG